MPQTEIRLFKRGNGQVPVGDWLDFLEKRLPKAHRKCLAAILELADKGNQLRRPYSDYLRDGIYELRVRLSKINYRMLYSFSGKNIVVLTNGFTKESAVPDAEIEFAIKAMVLVRQDATKYTAEFEV